MPSSFTLEIEYDVHNMFECLWPSDASVLGNMTDQKNRQVSRFRHSQQLHGGVTHLTHASRRRIERFRKNGLYRIDHKRAGPRFFYRLQNSSKIGLREQINIAGIVRLLRKRRIVRLKGRRSLPIANHRQLIVKHGLHPCISDSVRTEPDLPHGFLARGVQYAQSFITQRMRKLQKQRRFAHARLAAKKNQRTRNKSSTKRAVELRIARIYARSFFRRYFLNPYGAGITAGTTVNRSCNFAEPETFLFDK
jgi:hypothetical protein